MKVTELRKYRFGVDSFFRIAPIEFCNIPDHPAFLFKCAGKQAAGLDGGKRRGAM